MYEPGHAFQYALKMINPLRLSEYKTVNIQGAKHLAAYKSCNISLASIFQLLLLRQILVLSKWDT